jgi:hypothetical protein
VAVKSHQLIVKVNLLIQCLIGCGIELFTEFNTFLSSVIGVNYKKNFFPYEPLYLYPSERGNKDDLNESIVLNAGYSTYPNAFSAMYLWDVLQCNDYAIRITVAVDAGPFATRIDFTYLGESSFNSNKIFLKTNRKSFSQIKIKIRHTLEVLSIT